MRTSFLLRKLSVVTGSLLFSGLACATTTSSTAFNSAEFQQKTASQEKDLLKGGKLHALGDLLKDLQKNPKSDPITLPALCAEKLAPADLYEKLLPSTLVVGLYYKCADCGQMHLSIGGGFAIAQGGLVSTCAHILVLDPKKMKQAYPVAIDAAGKVYPIDKIIAFDAVADTTLIHVAGGNFPPLPMRSETRVGEPIYCLSHPGDNFFMFTSGMVNRIEARTEQDRLLRSIDVTCDYSPGSSGCPITDSAGNVVAQVEKVFPQLMPGDNSPNGPQATVFTRHSAMGANEIAHLADPANRPLLTGASQATAQTQDAPSGRPAAETPDQSAQPFVIHSKFDLVIAPADEPLDREVKSFADLFRRSSDSKSGVSTWSSLHELEEKISRSDDPIGFMGVSGYYQDPKSTGPRTVQNTTARGIDFKFTFHDRTANEVGVAIAVDDNRETPAAAQNKFNVEARAGKDTFTLVKLGPPQKGKQAWLALFASKFDGNEVPVRAEIGLLPAGKNVDFKFTAADGKEVDTTKMRGKVILVDFWATWCGPCIQSLPRLEELYKKYHGQGFEIIGINMDNERVAMDLFLASHPHPWPQSISAPAGKNPLADRFEIKGIPFFLLIDKAGEATIIDARMPDTEKLIAARLKQAG